MSSRHLGDGQKEMVAFGYKHTVHELFVAKANLFNPESFRCDNDLWGGADCIVTSGGSSCHMDWLVHAKAPFNETFKCASIKDITCS
jgi:hypothetical protein